MSIRKVFIFLAFCFVLIGMLTAGALVHLTDRMNELAQRTMWQMDGVRASEELQVSLLHFSRENLIYFNGGKVLSEASRSDFENQIRTHLRDVEKYVEAGLERELLVEIRSSAEEYLAVHRSPSKLPVNQVSLSRELPPVLERTLQLSEEFTTLNSHQADNLKLAITAENKRADLIAGILGLSCIVGFLLALYLLRHFLVQPISKLSEELMSISNKNRISTVAEAGPLEIRAISAAFNSVASQVLNQRETGLRFLAGVAHDLRNPLGAIRVSTDLLNDGDSTPEERSGIVQIISRQAQQLDRMVGDLLDTTRIEAGQLEIMKKKASLFQIVEDAVKLHRSVSSVHTINLDLPSKDIIVNVDPVRISQVLNNLLSNAIEYSPNGGSIDVRVHPKTSLVAIEISDQGMGISREDQLTVFEPFRRTKATRDTIPGVGLGLSVSKKIVESHGGTIQIESVVGNGTTFRVVLPAPELNREYRVSPNLQSPVVTS